MNGNCAALAGCEISSKALRIVLNWLIVTKAKVSRVSVKTMSLVKQREGFH